MTAGSAIRFTPYPARSEARRLRTNDTYRPFGLRRVSRDPSRPEFFKCPPDLGLPARVKRHVQVKERQRDYDEATWVEGFVVLNAAGGECVDDFERLREDSG
jgi:hypothetical protein